MAENKTGINKENIFKILIGLSFGLGIFDVLYSFTGVYATFGLLYPAAHVFLTIILFLSLSFIWSKEKWALYLFGLVILAHFGLDLFVGAFQLLKLLMILPLVFFVILWRD